MRDVSAILDFQAVLVAFQCVLVYVAFADSSATIACRIGMVCKFIDGVP